MSELGVYASFLKDTLYATVMVVLYLLARWPVYWVFLLHALTWVAFMLYYVADDKNSFWTPTVAICITLVTGGADFFALLNTMCYLPGAQCCLGAEAAAPFTLGEPVCGAHHGRYDTPPLTWLALACVTLGVFNAAWRVVGIYNTCAAASVEVGMAGLYVTIKVYVAVWRGLHFSPFFWAQTAFCVCIHAAAVVLGFKYGLKFVSSLLLLAAVAADVLVLSGVLPTVALPPGHVSSLWYFLHALAAALSALEILGFTTRSATLPGPFFASNVRAKEEERTGRAGGGDGGDGLFSVGDGDDIDAGDTEGDSGEEGEGGGAPRGAKVGALYSGFRQRAGAFGAKARMTLV